MPQPWRRLLSSRILSPEEHQIAAAERMVDNDMASAFRDDADFQAMEEEYPGLIEAVLKEMKPALLRFTRNGLPDHYKRVAALLATQFSAPELEDIAQFYLSPTGQKIIQGMHQNQSVGAVLAEVMADPDKPTSIAAVVSDQRATAEATKKLIDKGDEQALLELTKKPYFARLASLAPAMRKLDQELANEPAPEFEKEIEALVEATILRFEASKK